MSAELLTTAEVADRLGLTVRAVQKMIEAGRLEARKVGRDYLIAPSALENIPKQGPGRPPKAKAGKAGGPDGRVRVAKKGGKKPTPGRNYRAQLNRERDES